MKYLSLFFFGCILISCNNNKAVYGYEPTELVGQAYIDAYATPDVVFNYVRINETAQTATGWLVTRDAKVYTYNTPSFEVLKKNSIASISQLATIKDAGILNNKSIDLEDMVEQFKRTKQAAATNYIQSNTDANATETVYWVGYDAYVEGCEAGTCPPNSQPSESQVHLILLKSTGAFTGENTSNSAQQVITWMEELNGDL